jgi:hypothetical protein
MNTSTFTVVVGIVGHSTTAHGCLLPGDIFLRLYSGSELPESDISVTWSSDDMSTIERTIMGEFIVPNSVVKDVDNVFEDPHETSRRAIANAEAGQDVRVFVVFIN